MRRWGFISGFTAILLEGALQVSGITCLPLAIFLAIAAVGLLGWSAWPLIQQKVLVRLSRKKKVASLLVIIIVAIFAVISNQGYFQESPPSQDWQWSHPSPQEIWQEIEDYPPYNQETARQGYKGLSVTWGVTLFDATDSSEGVDIWATPIGQSSPSICFTINTSLYPEIKTMKRGQQFVVQGTIADIDTIHIKLDNCQLIFN